MQVIWKKSEIGNNFAPSILNKGYTTGPILSPWKHKKVAWAPGSVSCVNRNKETSLWAVTKTCPPISPWHTFNKFPVWPRQTWLVYHSTHWHGHWDLLLLLLLPSEAAAPDCYPRTHHTFQPTAYLIANLNFMSLPSQQLWRLLLTLEGQATTSQQHMLEGLEFLLLPVPWSWHESAAGNNSQSNAL